MSFSRYPGLMVGVVLALFFTFSFSTSAKESAFDYVENPEATHSEIGIKRFNLELVKEIKADFDDQLFFGCPVALTVDDQGSIYVYDQLLKRIYKFDNKFNYVTRFLSQGRGPGEIIGNGMGSNKIYFSPDGKIYVCAVYNNRILVFSRTGKLEKELKLEQFGGRREFHPVVDSKNNIYIVSKGNGIIDKFDKNMNKVYTYLTRDENRRFVAQKPPPTLGMPIEILLQPDSTNTWYDVVENDRLLVYLSYPSTVYLFDKDKMLRKFDVHLKSTMGNLRHRLAEIERRLQEKRKKINPDKNIGAFMGSLFHSFFVDKDDNQHFYLHDIDKQLRSRVFKFNLKGELLSSFLLCESGLKCNIYAKRNHLFYGLNIRDGKVYILRKQED